ncbi:ABC transporter ATP-binding protein [Atribacter sp.]|jgi:peptide/nickel transport system ATP-binding protein|uniref:Oligopeptide transport ATP-binding protein OppD n=2 Tax=Atribacter TaxID=2847777 RepID=A0A1V5SI01_9BACT|nr:ABC transporter ATP-binding protein [Atribacter sp.]OQA54117.1 MAG: Oligopeptide transport ATP-binding protein OppD [Candidatus Atribacteria bacterium ADurb.Bin276]
MKTMNDIILQINNLKTYLTTPSGIVQAVDGVDLNIAANQTLGLVGESGCGKSMTALSILKLYPKPQGKIVDGQIIFLGDDLVKKTEEEMYTIRGKKISMIFQEPMTSLDPVFPVGKEIVEVLTIHQKLSIPEAEKQAIELLKRVRIPEPKRRFREYPHQMSGGMRQRVMIAMALACRPALLIADEPTTALDVTIQAQIISLINDLKREFQTAVLLITHDLGIVAETCQQVAVMYAGKIVERADVYSIFSNTRHPYTVSLLNAIPRIQRDRQRLESIPGRVPNLCFPPGGCRFHPRCSKKMTICSTTEPLLKEIEKDHWVACHLY